jgi:colicin import membrane protein
MSSVPRHLEFAPPPTPGLLRSLGLAILAHAVLLAVLSTGVQWKRDAVQETFEAELWASVPVQAAAPAPELEPVPVPPKPVPPEPKPEPKPLPKPVPPPPDTSKAEADIALLKEKAKAKQLKEKKLALEKAELEKKKLAELEKEKLAKLEQDKKDKLDKQKKELAEKQKKEQTDKLTKAKDEQQRKQDAKEAQLIEDQRKAAIKRMAGLAGAGGNAAPGSNSTALEAKAPSDSYKGRIRAYIKRFHTYTETVSGNPTTEIEIRTASDGTIISRKITKSSGTKSWDDAALNAIDKAEKLPLDENGRAPPPMILVWSAQELAR